MSNAWNRIFAIFLTLFAGLGVVEAAPASFTITAANTTVTAEGSGSLPFTLTSVNGYAGNLDVSCIGTNAPIGARVPYCGAARGTYALTAGGTVSGTLQLTGSPVPAAETPSSSDVGFAVFGLLGSTVALMGIRRKRGRRMLLLCLCAASFCIGAVGCGGHPGLTPGTYIYTVEASDYATHATATSAASVTVP